MQNHSVSIRLGSYLRLSPRLVGALAAVVTVAIWTAFIVVARASADPSRAPTLTPYDILCARLLGSGMVLLPLGLWLSRQQRRLATVSGALLRSSLGGLSPLPLGITVRIGLFGGLLYALTAYSGFVYAPAAHAAVLLPGSLPLWTTLLALWLLGDRLTPARVAGLLCIVVGDLLVGGASMLHAAQGSRVWRGDLLFIVGAIAWAMYSVLVRKHALSAVHATTAITALACCVYLPIYTVLVAGGWVEGHIFTAPWHDVAVQMGMQGVGSVVISGITYNIMIRHFGPVRSSMLTAVVPGLSALSANLLLGEPLPWNVVCGLLLVTGGILFGVRQARARAS